MKKRTVLKLGALVVAAAMVSMGATHSVAANPTPGLPSTPLVTGSTIQFPSLVIGETRPITIQLPPAGPAASFDVLVVLDAETHDHHVSGISRFLASQYVNVIPKTMVVGVINTDRLRDTTPTATAQYPNAGGVRNFIRFIEEELLPWIDANYSTTGRRILVGHSGSALAAMYALIETPNAFDSIIAVDPSLGWDDGVFLQDALLAWNQSPDPPTRLELSSYRDKETTKAVLDLILRRGPSQLSWNYSLYGGESHNSMVHRAVYDSLINLQSN